MTRPTERSITETHRALEALFKAAMAEYSRLPPKTKKATDAVIQAAGRD